MPRVPDTRASLILRLPTKADVAAWREFVELYEPFLHRFARRSGLQEADARELVQDVLLSVVQAVGHWQQDSTRAKFRTWLFRIARNKLIDVLSKRQRQATRIGGSGLLEPKSRRTTAACVCCRCSR
jgi:RNA polymerase sigma-70 factor (ECF subfamily)